MIFVVGFIDDVREMSAPAKMAGQVLAAMVLVFLGVTMFQFKIPFVGFFVALPRCDAVAHGVVGHRHHQCREPHRRPRRPRHRASWPSPRERLALYGLRLVFVEAFRPTTSARSSRWWRSGSASASCRTTSIPPEPSWATPARSFLGLLLAASTMLIGGRTPDVSGQTYFFFAPLFIPIFILGVPIADMAFAFIRRTARGTGFHTPDKDHVHHRLLRLGHGPRRTVAILWAWTAVLSAFLLYPLFDKQGNAVIPFGVIVLGPGVVHAVPSRAPQGHPQWQRQRRALGDAGKRRCRSWSRPPVERLIGSSGPATWGRPGATWSDGDNGTGPGDGDAARATTPVTHASSRLKYRP